jgi:hypothetical protein
VISEFFSQLYFQERKKPPKTQYLSVTTQKIRRGIHTHTHHQMRVTRMVAHFCKCPQNVPTFNSLLVTPAPTTSWSHISMTSSPFFPLSIIPSNHCSTLLVYYVLMCCWMWERDREPGQTDYPSLSRCVIQPGESTSKQASTAHFQSSTSTPPPPRGVMITHGTGH